MNEKLAAFKEMVQAASTSSLLNSYEDFCGVPPMQRDQLHVKGIEIIKEELNKRLREEWQI